MQRLRAAEHRRHRLQRDAHDVVVRLLRGQRHAGGLRVRAEHQRLGLLRVEALLHQRRPETAGGAELRDLLEEVRVHVEEERQPRGEVVDVQAAVDTVLYVGEPVGDGEGELLPGRRARLADVIAADRDAVPARHLAGAERDGVTDDAHRGARGHDPGVLRDELLEAVVLDGAADLRARHAAEVREGDVEGEQDGGGAVDRHRGRHLLEGDPVEEDLHVLERVDGDSAHPDLTERARRVAVVAHQRGEIEGGGEARLPVGEQELEALVGLLRRPEAGEHAHGPEATAVHGGLNAAGVGEFPREAERALVVLRGVERRREVGDVHVGERREALLAERQLGRGLRDDARLPVVAGAPKLRHRVAAETEFTALRRVDAVVDACFGHEFLGPGAFGVAQLGSSVGSPTPGKGTTSPRRVWSIPLTSRASSASGRVFKKRSRCALAAAASPRAKKVRPSR